MTDCGLTIGVGVPLFQRARFAGNALRQAIPAHVEVNDESGILVHLMMTSLIKLTGPPAQSPRNDLHLPPDTGYGIGIFGFEQPGLLVFVGIQQRCPSDYVSICFIEQSPRSQQDIGDGPHEPVHVFLPYRDDPALLSGRESVRYIRIVASQALPEKHPVESMEANRDHFDGHRNVFSNFIGKQHGTQKKCRNSNGLLHWSSIHLNWVPVMREFELAIPGSKSMYVSQE